MRKYKNPIMMCDKEEYGKTSDPYALRYEGLYYYCYATSDGVYITEAKELCDLETGTETKIFADTPEVSDWYAPELHRIDNKWYIYGAPAMNGGEVHTMCVLEYDGETPMGSYEFKGVVGGLEDKWSIDGTILENKGVRYFIWTDCGKLYMAKMDSPYSITGETIVLAKCAEFEFERRNGSIIEGPAVLKRGNKIHIVYSANNSKTDDYCLGILTCCSEDVFNSANWKKSENAVFEKTNEVFGPGHCSFTAVTENGVEEDYIIYHANLEAGSGWPGRCIWTQKFGWDENDMPVFGSPMINPV